MTKPLAADLRRPRGADFFGDLAMDSPRGGNPRRFKWYSRPRPACGCGESDVPPPGRRSRSSRPGRSRARARAPPRSCRSWENRPRVAILRLRVLKAHEYVLLRERLRRQHDNRAAGRSGGERARPGGRVQVLECERPGRRTGLPGDRRGRLDAHPGAATGALSDPIAPSVTT